MWDEARRWETEMKIRHCDRCHKEMHPEAPNAVQHEDDFFVINVKHMAMVGSCVQPWEVIELEVCKECAKELLPEMKFKGLPAEIVAARKSASPFNTEDADGKEV